MYNTRKLSQLALQSVRECFTWLQKEGLVLSNVACPVCNSVMKTHIYGNAQVIFSCKKTANPHCVKMNALEKSFFVHSKFSLVNIVTFVYFFSQNVMSYTFLMRECTNHEISVTRSTVAQWLLNCREACLIWLYNVCDRDLVLGGPGVLVEVDLCRVGKCKYNAEVLAEGTWLLGMMELNSNNDTQRRERYRLEVCADERRDPESVITLVAKHSLPGTRIVTNLWGEYFGLPNNKYHHYTVNDSQSFVEPMSENSCHLLESSWQAKKHTCRSKSEYTAPYLAEYLYRREVKLSGEDSFAHFLRVIRAPFPHA